MVVVVDLAVRLLQELAAAEEAAPYLRPLSRPSPDANQAFCLHNAKVSHSCPMAEVAA